MFGVSRQIRQMGVEALTKPWLSHRNDVLLRRTKVHGTILRGGHQRPRKWPQWVKDLKVQFLCTCLQNAFSSLAWWYSVLSQVKLYLCHYLPVKLILLQPNASKPTNTQEWKVLLQLVNPDVGSGGPPASPGARGSGGFLRDLCRQTKSRPAKI